MQSSDGFQQHASIDIRQTCLADIQMLSKPCLMLFNEDDII